MVEVSRLNDLNAAKLFLGFRIGTVGRRDFAAFPVQGQRGLRRLKRYFGDKMSVGAQMVVVLKAFVERGVSLVLGHPFEFPWLEVSQTDVFHPVLLVSCSGPPGALITQSSEMCSTTRIFLIGSPLILFKLGLWRFPFRLTTVARQSLSVTGPPPGRSYQRRANPADSLPRLRGLCPNRRT